MSKGYVDFKLMEQIPNKYNLKAADIRKLRVLNWEKLKELTWYNNAMEKTGKWWCHLEGCNSPNTKYDDFSEFWIGFDEASGKVRFHFTTCEGMCSYNFSSFYSSRSIEHKYDMQVQANAMRFLNKLLDENIVTLDAA